MFDSMRYPHPYLRQLACLTLVAAFAADSLASTGGTPIADNVCNEAHDRGLIWKDYALVRRGQELSLWGALGAGNYNYVMEWIFRDDGMLIGRVDATAVI